MNIMPPALQYIIKAAEVAESLGLASVIIEPGMVRGMDAGQTMFILHTTDVPDFEFGSIAITRLDLFAKRMEMITSGVTNNVKVTAELDSIKDISYIRSLDFKGSKLKMAFRCASPVTIKSPKQINDTGSRVIEFNSDLISVLQKGRAAMKATEVKIEGNDDGVWAILTDSSGDDLSFKFSDQLDTDGEFAYTYPLQTLLSLLTQSTTQTFSLTNVGFLRINYKGFSVVLLPRN